MGYAPTAHGVCAYSAWGMRLQRMGYAP